MWNSRCVPWPPVLLAVFSSIQQESVISCPVKRATGHLRLHGQHDWRFSIRRSPAAGVGSGRSRRQQAEDGLVLLGVVEAQNAVHAVEEPADLDQILGLGTALGDVV